ncbi:hypothetical protein G7046_g8851 [Stylonectria norvegica]|nr:hypothetical protein G7046_g8851 [Stylonectria norvegica]
MSCQSAVRPPPGSFRPFTLHRRRFGSQFLIPSVPGNPWLAGLIRRPSFSSPLLAPSHNFNLLCESWFWLRLLQRQTSNVKRQTATQTSNIQPLASDSPAAHSPFRSARKPVNEPSTTPGSSTSTDSETHAPYPSGQTRLDSTSFPLLVSGPELVTAPLATTTAARSVLLHTPAAAASLACSKLLDNAYNTNHFSTTTTRRSLPNRLAEYK